MREAIIEAMIGDIVGKQVLMQSPVSNYYENKK